MKKSTWVGKYFIAERYVTENKENDTVEGIEIFNGLSGFSCKLFIRYSLYEFETFIPFTGVINYTKEYQIAYNSLTNMFNTGTELI